MNLREGRSGVREMTAAAVIGTVTNGLFAVNNADAYRNGNMQYAATAAAVLLSLLFVGLMERAMAAQRTESLDGLLTASFGRGGGAVVGLAAVAGLLIAAVLPMTRFLLILTRYVFVEDDLIAITLYLLPVILLLSYFGLEAIVRTSYLSVWLLGLAFLGAIAAGLPLFRSYRLFPLLGGSTGEFLMQTLASLFRFLPAVTALLAVGKGANGVIYAVKAARRGLLIGGGITVLMQVCIGLTFTSDYLAQLPAPMYHFTMQPRYDHPTMRVDKLILFLWIVFGLLAAAFYVYAAALLFCRLFGAEDSRPVAVVMSAVCTGAMLLLHFSTAAMHEIVTAVYRYAYLLLLVPLFSTALIAFWKRRRPAWQG